MKHAEAQWHTLVEHTAFFLVCSIAESQQCSARVRGRCLCTASCRLCTARSGLCTRWTACSAAARQLAFHARGACNDSWRISCVASERSLHAILSGSRSSSASRHVRDIDIGSLRSSLRLSWAIMNVKRAVSIVVSWNASSYKCVARRVGSHVRAELGVHNKRSDLPMVREPAAMPCHPEHIQAPQPHGCQGCCYILCMMAATWSV